MPYHYSVFVLPGGARCARFEWSGVATGEEAVALVAECAPGSPLHGLPLLVLAQKMERMEPEARSFFSHRGNSPTIAIVVSSPIIRVTGNFIMRMNKSTRQRMFSNEADAIQWLDERAREHAL
ncbi:MAG TPA: STAS/SEC14 domain-containing protein [Myxococcaceae bacterium]|nr:STAS/SEC14 domain-containing protein [Myxococcaceae bacterium]